MKMETNIKANYLVVESLRHALGKGTHGLSVVPDLVKRVLKEDSWREFMVRQTGEIARYERFEDFVKATPLEGLGGDITTIQRLCRDNPEALALLEREGIGTFPDQRLTDLAQLVCELAAAVESCHKTMQQLEGETDKRSFARREIHKMIESQLDLLARARGVSAQG